MTDDPVNNSGEAGETGTTLLSRIREKDPRGWERFVHLYSPLIYRWCRQGGLNETDAADVGQEVFQAVARAIASFHRDQAGDSFRGWLRTIVQNKLRDRNRRPVIGGTGIGGEAATRLHVEVAAPAELPDADDASTLDDELILMRRAVELVLADYDETTRKAFLRVVAGEEDPATVAEELGMTLNRVYLAKSRIKRQIREEFAGLLETS